MSAVTESAAVLSSRPAGPARGSTLSAGLPHAPAGLRAAAACWRPAPEAPSGGRAQGDRGWPDPGSDPVYQAPEVLPTTCSWAGPAAQQTGPYTQRRAPRHKRVPFGSPLLTHRAAEARRVTTEEATTPPPPWSQNWDASRRQLVGLLWAGNCHVARAQLALGPPQIPPTGGDAAPFIPQLGQETSSRQAQGDTPYPGPCILSGSSQRGTLPPTGLPHHQGRAPDPCGLPSCTCPP